MKHCNPIYSNIFIEKRISRCNVVTYITRAIDFSDTAIHTLQHIFLQKSFSITLFEKSLMIMLLSKNGHFGGKNRGF